MQRITVSILTDQTDSYDVLMSLLSKKNWYAYSSLQFVWIFCENYNTKSMRLQNCRFVWLPRLNQHDF